MRYPADHKAKTHHRILAAAARHFRERGFRATGVDELMKAAGLTAGGFYAHFRSKRALLAEILAQSLAQVRERLLAGNEHLEGAAWLRAVVGRYLSRLHRDASSEGCPIPALAPEIGREGAPAQAALERYLRDLVGELAPRTPTAPGLSPEDRVLATVALCAGALMLARAVRDEELSERILRSARRLAVPETAEAATAEAAARTREEKRR